MTLESSQLLTPKSASEPPLLVTSYQELCGSTTQQWDDPVEEHKEWFSTHGLPEREVSELLAKHNRIEIEVEEDVWFLDRLKAFLLDSYGNTQQKWIYRKISDHMMFHFKKATAEERDVLEDNATNAGSIYATQVSRL